MERSVWLQCNRTMGGLFGKLDTQCGLSHGECVEIRPYLGVTKV